MSDLNYSVFLPKLQNYLKANGCEGDENFELSKEDFLKNICNDESIFNQLDTNKDGKISIMESNLPQNMDIDKDGIVTDKERKKAAMEEAEFYAKRDVDKWFATDVNRDMIKSNVELKLLDNLKCKEYREVEYNKDGALTNDELAKKYNMQEASIEFGYDLEEDLKENQEIIEQRYGVKLSKADIVRLRKSAITQLNRWLFKIGDNATKNAPLYDSLNVHSYTRLTTDEELNSCCGGAIDKPPVGPQYSACFEKVPEENIIFHKFSEEIQKNTSTEVKNRLAWAIFPTKTENEVAKMSPEEYKAYQAEWEKVRNMKKSDFEELIKPENKAKKEEFENTSYMTVEQILQYINIVESETKTPFDNENWSIDYKQQRNIVLKINDTYDDDKRLEGKTRKDVPENRQALLRYLEEKGWLLEQFK